MTTEHLEFRVAIDEVSEAIAVLGRWENRADELPKVLRDQLEELRQRRPETLCSTTGGPEISVVLVPELRALIANLRARDGLGQI